MAKNDLTQDELDFLEKFRKTPEREKNSCIIDADRFGNPLDKSRHMTVELDEEGYYTLVTID